MYKIEFVELDNKVFFKEFAHLILNNVEETEE